MNNTQGQAAGTSMTWWKAASIYGALLAMWLGMWKLAIDTQWFPNGALIAFHLFAGFVLNRVVMRGLIQWHPHHATLRRVTTAKLYAFFLWPLTYGLLLVRLAVDAVL